MLGTMRVRGAAIQALSLAALLLSFQTPAAPSEPRQPPQPSGNLASYIRGDDYPASAVARRAQGTVGVRLFVASDGSVRRCIVESSSGHEDLDRRTCEILAERARFTPARDGSGQPIEDSVTTRVRWQLTDDAEPLFEGFRFIRRVVASPGEPLSCTLRVNQGGTDMSGGDCERLVGPDVLRWIGGQGVRVEYTELISFAPEGSGPVPMAPADYGNLLEEAEVEVTIGPDGRVAECRPAEGGESSAASAQLLCAFARSMSGFWPSSAAGNRGRIRSAVYLRVGTRI